MHASICNLHTISILILTYIHTYTQYIPVVAAAVAVVADIADSFPETIAAVVETAAHYYSYIVICMYGDIKMTILTFPM